MNKTKKMVFIGIYIALAVVLDFIKEFIPFLNMPAGGSINIALIPIVVASFHLGSEAGFVTGILWWVVSSLLGLNKYYLSIPQYIFDYILPSFLPGLASFAYKNGDDIKKMEMGIITVMIIRTFVLVISGVYFWPGELAAGSLAAWSASLIYNLPYNLATLLMLMMITPLIIKRMNVIR